MQAIAVCRELAHCGQSRKTVRSGVFDGKGALVNVGHPFSARLELVAPGVALPGQSAPGRKLPFGLRREPFAGPLRVGHGVGISHMHDGIVRTAFQVGLGALGMPPVGAFFIPPPEQEVVQVHRPRGWREHRGSRHQVLQRRRRELLPGRRNFRDGFVAGGRHEFFELGIGDLGLIHPKAVHVNPVDGLGVPGQPGATAEGFVRRIAAHGKLAAGDPHHPFRCRARGRRLVFGGGKKFRGLWVFGPGGRAGRERPQRDGGQEG